MSYSIGENIKIMRRKCGFTQEELAVRLAVTPQAISKWENGNGTPDISQLVPLSKIFGITTDSLLGVDSSTFGNAHTEATLGHEKILMSTSKPDCEKHLLAYTYFRAESEKEPTNFVIMRKCIQHGAEVSRYVDFDGFLSDKPELRDEIFADCERKNLCISRYCEDKSNVEKSDYAMIWIYLHIKDFENAKKLIDRLPSLESNNLKEHIMTQFIHFQFGFEEEKKYIEENIGKLINATAKEFFFSLEDYAWFADSNEAIEYIKKALNVLTAYKVYDKYIADVIFWENKIRNFMVRCYARVNDFEGAGNEIKPIVENCLQVAKFEGKDVEQTKELIQNAIQSAIYTIEENQRSSVTDTEAYKSAVQILESIK